MVISRSLALCIKIFRSCLVMAPALGLISSESARAERILDLRFWSQDQSMLALGGLWEFHAQTLLEPSQRQGASDLLLDISHPWRDFRPMSPAQVDLLERGSYVLLLKGLQPSAKGYALQMNAAQAMTRLIVAPKYAPERSQSVQHENAFAAFPLLRTMLRPQLRLVFTPKSAEEIWMIIVQRWQVAPDARGAIPHLR